MANAYFQFKQFVVYQDKCAMKVGTDGVLLGAWARVKGAREILDAGTGTGLIGLMVAQRNLTARVTAVELDAAAAEQARENMERSPFADRMTLAKADLRNYARVAPGKFDHIVCNPPYFVGSLLSPDKYRTQARHAVNLTPAELLEVARVCLKEQGGLSLILPFDAFDDWKRVAQEKEFSISRITRVYPKLHGAPKRVLLELVRGQVVTPEIEQLTIEMERHCYSREFKSLLKDFYLYL